MSSLSDALEAMDGANGLKPCPFCGGKASDKGEVHYVNKREPNAWWADGSPIEDAFFCNCTSCGASNQGITGGFQTKEKAIEAWNTRMESDALAWIKEALPTVEEKARHLAQLKREYEVGIKLAMGHQIDRFEAEIKSITTELIALDALIARAKPEEVGRC